MLEVDVEVSETDHSASDISLPLIPLFVLIFALTDGYHYALSLFTTHDKELIPSYVDFLELYDWPPGYNDNDPVSECIVTGSKSLLERRSPGEIKCCGFMDLNIAQESVENVSPHEMVVVTHTQCFVVHKQRFHHQLPPWPRFGMPAPHPNGVTTIITSTASTGDAAKPFNLLVDEPVYFNTC